MARLVAALLLSLVFAPPAPAQTTPTAGFLFSYRPHESRRAVFEAGYRDHLEWHREQRDSLTWFGWDVIGGPGLGLFVDGVFGVPFAALDRRVDPRGDAQDAALNVEAHADPVQRELLRLRDDLGTATPLESGTPAPIVQVVRATVAPGHERALETAFQALLRDGTSRQLLPYTVYEVVAGARHTFVMMVWRSSMGSFDQHERNPDRALRRVLQTDDRTLPTAGSAPVVDMNSEIWLYRPDLTYFGIGREAR
jgi:hypothetical protein